jgi:hypothetical protein
MAQCTKSIVPLSGLDIYLHPKYLEIKINEEAAHMEEG